MYGDPPPNGPAGDPGCGPGLVLKDGVCVTPTPGGGGGQTSSTHPADDRFSEQQWQAWEQYKDPACPPNAPYKSERGAEGCFEKPVDCPDGKMPSGPNTTDPCMPNPTGSAFGGGGGKGGGGFKGAASGFNQWKANLPFDQWLEGYKQTQAARNNDSSWLGTLSAKQMAQAHMYYDRAAAAGFGGSAPGTGGGLGNLSDYGINGRIAAEITKILGGETSFSPKIMADITAGNKLAQQGSLAGQTQALRESQSARGIIGSPAGGAAEGRLIAASGAAFDQGQRELRVTKAKQDFQDKLGAMKAAQDWMNSLRNYALGLDTNNVAREGIMANLKLGEDKLQADLRNLILQLNSNKELLGMQLDSSESMQLTKILQCLAHPEVC